MITIGASLLVAAVLASSAHANPTPVNGAEEACALVEARFAARNRFPKSRLGFCDVIAAANSPPGFFVLALHSTRKCDGICSTLLGWFAVERSTGRVFDWDVGEWELGAELTRRH